MTIGLTRLSLAGTKFTLAISVSLFRVLGCPTSICIFIQALPCQEGGSHAPVTITIQPISATSDRQPDAASHRFIADMLRLRNEDKPYAWRDRGYRPLESSLLISPITLLWLVFPSRAEPNAIREIHEELATQERSARKPTVAYQALSSRSCHEPGVHQLTLEGGL